MNLCELNNFSKQIYSQIHEYYPRLINQAEEKPESNGNFYLNILSPIEEENIWLGIYTDANPFEEQDTATGEVTWEYDYFHSHSFSRTAQDAFEWLKEELDPLFKGFKFVGSRIEAGKSISSTILNKEALDELLAWKFDHRKNLGRTIEQLTRLTRIPEAERDLIIKQLNNATQLNRIVGWENIFINN